MIDTHTHLNFPELKAELTAVLARAEAAGVTDFVVPGTDLPTSTSSVELSGENPHIFTAVGLHPTDVLEYSEELLLQIKELVESSKKVVSIGEVGLDYYHFEGLATPEAIAERKALQAQVFTDFIGLARSQSLPLIIHSRDAALDTQRLLDQHAPKHPAVIHCFTGSLEESRQYLDLGCLLSFTGIITYKKNEQLREVVRQTPLDRLMLETDSPFLAPEGHRGERGEPKFVREVAECIAAVKGITLEKVDAVTTATAKQFFNLGV